MNIELLEFGATLGSREVGEQIRHVAENALHGGETVVIDFSGVAAAAPSFIDELFGGLVTIFGVGQLRGRLKVEAAPPEVQALIRRMMAERVREGPALYTTQAGASSPAPEASHSAAQAASPTPFDPFAVLRQVQQDYLAYVRTFQRFQNPEISDWVMEHIENGSLLWKPPYIQIARPFAPGERLEALVERDLLHPGVLRVFRTSAEDGASSPIHPHNHQTAALQRILTGHNVIIATGTGSGKSFAFGIPIVSAALRQQRGGVRGIKAVIVYPMNALANSQYDEFARRLHGSGVRIALYTGDTASSPAEALRRYRESSGRMQPFDSEVLSREEIQHNPPDILMTNYVMLELLLTRFEDRRLFAQQGVLQFLVLDEIHTYSGKRGADVAALLRRLKQHTHTAGGLRCIGTSATVESGGQESAAQAISEFAKALFGESFTPEDVISEVYAPLPQDLNEVHRRTTELLAEQVRSIADLSQELNLSRDEIERALINAPGLPPKLHAFFSQGRAISACMDIEHPHLNDRGEVNCPVCAEAGRQRPTYTMVFCRACGQEYYSVAVDEHGRLDSTELDSIEARGRTGYLLLQHWNRDTNPLPETWWTLGGRIAHRFDDVTPEEHPLCPDCGELDGNCAHRKLAAIFLPAPFLFCPNCGISHDRRSREFNKLFTFGSVGRSTATDVLINAQIRGLPRGQKKVIAFSDNRQDAALQAAHMNSLHNRFAFRRALFHTLRASRSGLDLGNIGMEIFDTLRSQNMLPRYSRDERLYGGDQQADERYQEYLVFLTLQELRGTHRRTHQNLEDVGLLVVGYSGLDQFAADESAWADIPLLHEVTAANRYDLLLGFLDLIRKRQAIRHTYLTNPQAFRTNVLSRLNDEILIHDEDPKMSIGYSDTAPESNRYVRYRFTGTNTQLTAWVRRVLAITTAEANDLIAQLVAKLARSEIGFLQKHAVTDHNTPYDLYMVPAEIITLRADPVETHWLCPKCLTVQRFRQVRICTGSTCHSQLVERNMKENYFRQMYDLPLDIAGRIKAEEHSGQVSGEERRKIEINFRDANNPLNVLICTPTMELGIDIGHLSAVTLRNVPPSPSNYAQRAGRAGRSGQPSLISVFAGVGAARGPHDQYFYSFPEKMITGAIAAPRFRLDNQFLLKSHIRALVLETMGLAGGERLPARPDELLDLELENYPLRPDLVTAWRTSLERQHGLICQAVHEAFQSEMQAYVWFSRDFVEATVSDFINSLDRAMERWRGEYQRLDQERLGLNLILGTQGVDPVMSRRRVVIERKLEEMRSGEGDWYVYRYLGGEGFLPGYAFPPQATHLSFDQREDELARDPAIALSEYAPGNFIYYRGERFEVTHGRPKTRQMEPETERILLCETCGRAYRGEQDTNRAACLCGQSLEATHPRLGMPLCDMYGMRRARITSDEEERLRLGYEITPHYIRSGYARSYKVNAQERPLFKLSLEGEGEILLINHGTRNRQGQSVGFTLCRKCYAWLLSEDAVNRHVRGLNQQGDCSNGAVAGDLLHNLWLTHLQRSDLAILTAPLPAGIEPLVFYTTLKNAILRALMVAFQVDESELDGFLMPDPENPSQQRIILYETATGGSGVLSALNEPDRLNLLFARIRELLHGGGGEDGCEKACYECLLSFYNQREHALMDRRVIVDWLTDVETVEIEIDSTIAPEYLESLRNACESELERMVLEQIVQANLRLPDAVQHTIYDLEGAPVAIADFYYQPRVVVFVDGSPHYRDYVQDADGRKRRELMRLGYRVVEISAGFVEEDLQGLRERLA